MKKNMMWAFIPLTLMAMVSGCSSDNDSPTINPAPKVEMTRTEQEMVYNNNEFAFNLFREAHDPVKSQILSPISITYALGMLNNGASGETQAQINKVFGSNLGADEINAFCRKMLKTAPSLDLSTKIKIANNIYMNKDYELKPDFKQTAKTFYDAEPETRNFADGMTRDVINKWGSDHTEKMIPEVLKESEFDSEAVSYLLNAIYFKGNWAEKFKKDDTKNETFTAENNNKKQVPMMHQNHKFNYKETAECQVLRLPYGNGSFLMTILLPKEDRTISDVAETLTADSWQRLQFMEEYNVDVKLPRFESETDIDLCSIMSRLGMPDAFEVNKADFSNFCTIPTYIGLMKQAAKIKVNEEGSEAAAVTVISGLETASGREPESLNATFHAIHPFLYVISERQTGAIFFIGQYTGN